MELVGMLVMYAIMAGTLGVGIYKTATDYGN